jgi:alkylation response protein AidB-like acyl-CoA dehydrogenase
MADLGLLGAPIPQEWGGLGTDTVAYCLVCEEIAKASASVFTTALTVHVSLFQMPILKWAGDALKKRYLPKTTKGKLLGAFCMTEPNVGSDSASIETTATQSGSNWVLNGSKMWISNGGIADLLLVLAQTDKTKKHKGIAAFLVERTMPGFASKDIHNKLGLKSSNTAELSFQDCKVPAENMVGQVGDGFKVGMYALDNGRTSTAAACVGIAQGAIDAAVKYSQERIQFGKPIASFQLVQELIVESIVETEAARFLVHRAAYLKDKGEPFTKEACMAKYYAAEVAARSATKAIKVHGGYGYSGEYPVERLYRDAMGLLLYEGTGEIQKLIIGRESIGIPAFA